MAFITALLMTLQAPVAAPAPAERYAEGQVWEYRTRPGDSGSLVKIQKIEPMPGDPQHRSVYHVSIIGVHLNAAGATPTLQHLTVSRQSLDTSVTRLSTVATGFPPLAQVEQGIAFWRGDHGGVFTIPLADIVAATEQMMQRSVGSQN